jgi:uncharacterized protein
MPKRSVKGVAQRIVRDDARARKEIAINQTRARLGQDVPTAKGGTPSLAMPTLDSFVNFAQKLGVGADNALSTASYGFNPITRIRTILEWIHRGSWLGGVAIDLKAADMTRAGVNLLGSIKPDDIKKLDTCATRLAIWSKLKETIQWSRLYGGALAFMMIDGQDQSTPLRLDTIRKGQFKGLVVLDRWMVDSSLNNVVTDFGPSIGLPKFYTVVADAPALPGFKIHYTRCIRLEGIKLPFYQKMQENMWGISVLERLYDRMIAFDSATTGAAQLVYKAYIRTYKIEGLREIAAAGGPSASGLAAYVNMMRTFQGIEGVTLMDLKDEFEGHSNTSFSGLDGTLTHLAQQLSGALQIPLVRLFGQSPSGFSSGDTDIRMYYDGIKQEQDQDLLSGVTDVYRAMAASEGIKLSDDFGLEFRSLWQILEKEKAEIATTVMDTVTKGLESGIFSDKSAMQEVKQSSRITGIGTNISEEDIEAANDTPEPPPTAEEAALMGENGLKPEEQGLKEETKENGDKPAKPAPAEKPAATTKPVKPAKADKE